MYDAFRPQMFNGYRRARDHFIHNPDELIEIERYLTNMVCSRLHNNYHEFVRDYNEASYLNPFWANYPPDDRGRAPVGDQIPWIEVGEHAIGHKLSRLISMDYLIAEVGLPSGADNRFVLRSDEIFEITGGYTDLAFVFLDIKSVGPRDNFDSVGPRDDFDHTVISPYQVSGDGIWNSPEDDLINSTMTASGRHVCHSFYPAISPIYVLSNGAVAPTVHIFVKPIYQMLSGMSRGQPLEKIEVICVPTGLLLTQKPGYLAQYPNLFFPGKDDKGKDPRKVRARVSFQLLREIASWRVQELAGDQY